jgi:uncharacterized phage protein (TIGR02216 family)
VDCSHANPSAKAEGLFVVSASRLAGLAALVLGWRPEEFWRATPAELASTFDVLGGEQVGAGSDDLERLRGMFPDG